VDELFERLDPPLHSFEGIFEHLIGGLVRRLDLTAGEMAAIGHGLLRVRRAGRSVAAEWLPAPRSSRSRPPPGTEAQETPGPPRAARPLAEGPPRDPAALILPLTYAGRMLGELNLTWRSEGARRRGAPGWLPGFARQCALIVHRFQARDWAARRLGRPLLLVGMSPAVRELERHLERVSASRLAVLLSGEFGTERLPLAAAIHAGGPRRDQSFVVVNCAEPAGGPGDWFEQAAGGTLYLDNVDELSLQLQRQLPLHLGLSFGHWLGGPQAPDVRVIASTMTDLRARVTEGRFSQGLLNGLDVLSVTAPPLRTRASDMEALVAAALERHGFRVEEKRTDALMAACRAYGWPENLLELERVVARLAVMTDTRPIEREDIRLHCPWVAAGGQGEAGGPRRGEPPSPADRWIRCAISGDMSELGKLHSAVARALVYLGQHYAEPLALGPLARQAHVSQSHLSYLFRSALGMPFKGLLVRIRIHKAKEMLASDTRQHITEVALSVGFSDLSHFEKSFKRVVGQSPREYRRAVAVFEANAA
jgi:AraC-like DNA-binding protein